MSWARTCKEEKYEFEISTDIPSRCGTPSRREKVRFHNRYGIELAGDLYLPKGSGGKLAAVAVAGPFGAVKEQCAGLYAEELASPGLCRPGL